MKALKIALLGGALLAAFGFALLPRWPADWVSNVAGADQFTIPITRWGGAFVLLALLRWRRPEARLIVAMACVPQTAYWYEALPLLLVPATFRESLILSLLSGCGFLLERQLVGNQPGAAFHDVGSLMIAFVYLPATLLVLRRPNSGKPPEWAELFRRRRAPPRAFAAADPGGTVRRPNCLDLGHDAD